MPNGLYKPTADQCLGIPMLQGGGYCSSSQHVKRWEARHSKMREASLAVALA